MIKNTLIMIRFLISSLIITKTTCTVGYKVNLADQSCSQWGEWSDCNPIDDLYAIESPGIMIRKRNSYNKNCNYRELQDCIINRNLNPTHNNIIPQLSKTITKRNTNENVFDIVNDVIPFSSDWNLTWPDSIFRYKIAPDFVDTDNTKRNQIEEAINKVKEAFSFDNCLTFEKVDENFIPTTDYPVIEFMSIERYNMCSSEIGATSIKKRDFTQFIQVYGCSNYGSIIHEILHALGHWHTHQRSDRNKHIVIHPENIIQETIIYSQFIMYDFPLFESEFDFESIMLYPQYAGSKSYLPTMTRNTNGDTTFTTQRNYLSYGDKFYIRK
eukprot:Pgem_evm1s5013